MGVDQREDREGDGLMSTNNEFEFGILEVASENYVLEAAKYGDDLAIEMRCRETFLGGHCCSLTVFLDKEMQQRLKALMG